MNKYKDFPVNPELDLVLERIVDIPRHLVWKAWTQPELLKQWFCPPPWKTVQATIELYPGGTFNSVMRSPEGQEMTNPGCYLEVVENERLTFTSSLTEGFRPSDASFMTAVITLSDHPKGTKYHVHALHKDAATRKQHEQMGFMTGWSIALDQLVALMKKEM